LTSPASPRLDWPQLREMVCRLIVRLPSSEICQWRVDVVNKNLAIFREHWPYQQRNICSFRNQYPVVTASEKIRTLQRVNRVRDGVRVRVLLAFSCLPIVCSANPQWSFYRWPVIERYDTNCSYLYTLANTTQLTKSAVLTDGSSSHAHWRQCVKAEYNLRLRNDLSCVEWGVKLYSLTQRNTTITYVHIYPEKM